MTVSDIIKGLLSMTGKKQADLAEVLGMSSKQAMSNKVRMNRWSADDLIKAAELCGGKVAIIMPDGQTIQLRNDEDEKKARTLDASGQERLFLARLVHGLRDVPHLFDPALRVGLSHDEVIQFAVKGLANEVEIIQADSLCKIVVQLIDGLGANPCCTCKFALCHPPFAEAGRQQNSNHSLLSPFTEILADMYPACLHFGRKLHISGVFSDFR